MPLEGAISYAEISLKTGLPVNRVRSIIRCSILNSIFTELAPNQVAHTSASSALARDPALRALYGHYLEDCFPASSKLAMALKKNPTSTSTTETAFNIAFDIKGTPFDFWKDHPERLRRFFMAMDGIARRPGYSLDHVIHGFAWQGFKDGSRVVDVCVQLLSFPVFVMG